MVLGVAANGASARTVVSSEANGAAVLKVVQPGAVALVVKVVATAATAARAAEAATVVGMVGKMASRTAGIDHHPNQLNTKCTRMELLCTGCWDPRYSTMHYGHCVRSSRMGSR